MNKELLDIQPRELKFTFERKKRSSCSIQLINNSNQYVAFKVKTTSPKNYCVQPNIGIVRPTSTCNFTVTMQAQREAPPDMQCKDKFLIQSTIVPFGTTEEDIKPSMVPTAVEELKPSKDVDSKPAKSVEELKPSKVVDSKPAKSVEELKLAKEIEELKLAKEIEEQKLAKATEELNSKLKEWKVKLSEADTSIAKLKAEGNTIIQEREALRQELAVLRRKNGVRRVNVGFPLLFVCMVGLIGVVLGYILKR
ncbi:vesicle-associated protein 1-3-like isoform X3 [Telopea speciosissima]|uniref:vesicle-associated protein 1-3-like isoform X3 n=1 Tax=Telopea speciosissima TaxID=54955 RepID=UPI001CC39ED1|nr:vesicle-associated protein 1-3-like isoform X3 [Telopea speciosissima]